MNSFRSGPPTLGKKAMGVRVAIIWALMLATGFFLWDAQAQRPYDTVMPPSSSPGIRVEEEEAFQDTQP